MGYLQNLKEDLDLFQKQYLTQWVQIMVDLQVFESTAKLKQNYSQLLQYLLMKLHWD
jgi:hypothetical protein